MNHSQIVRVGSPLGHRRLQQGAKARSSRSFYTVVGVVWGLLASFSFALTDENAALYQGAGLAVAVAAALLEQRSLVVFKAWASSWVGVLIAVHCVVALVSGVWAESTIAAIARYLLLMPAMAVLIAITQRGPDAFQGLRTGLTISGVVFVLFHAVELGPASVLDPEFRVSVFLNPNGVGFIVAITAVSLLSFRPQGSARREVLRYLLFAVACVVCLATKSRTALLTLVAGVLTDIYLRAKGSQRLKLGVLVASLAVLLVATTTRLTSEMGASLTRVYMLDDKYRSIESGTFRYDAWWFVITELWPRNPLLGVGPGQHSRLVEAAVANIVTAHNGVLANLAEVGLMGTAPLVAILGIALVRSRRHPAAQMLMPIVVAGIVESGAETMFFSMGNTGSLLFMAALANLGAGFARTGWRTSRVSDFR
jgi:O-antigen ligase